MRELFLCGATIAFAHGAIEAHPAEALCIVANADGIMASGHAGRVRLAAGPEIERELRAQAPLLLGTSYLTGPGNLASAGVRLIAHIIASQTPGAPVLRTELERGLDRAFEQLSLKGMRSLAMPDIGMRIPGISVEAAAALPVGALSRRLRLGASFERVTIVSLDRGYLQAARDRLIALGALDA